MRTKRLVVIILIATFVSVICYFSFSRLNKTDLPNAREHIPEIIEITFSSEINFNQIMRTLPIYQLSKDMYSENELKALGEGFGFHIDDLKKNDSSYDWYVEPGHYLTIICEGTFTYRNNPRNIDPTRPFPDDNILRAAAEEFLASNNLLEGFFFNTVTNGPVAELGSGRYGENRTVSFIRYIDDLPIYGNSRLTVSFDQELNITGVDSIQSPMLVTGSSKALSAKDVLGKTIEKGQGLRAFQLQEHSDRISIVITEIRQAYWENIDTNLVSPIFHYTGDVLNEEGEYIGKFAGIEQGF